MAIRHPADDPGRRSACRYHEVVSAAISDAHYSSSRIAPEGPILSEFLLLTPS